jgi:acetylglutamate kinase
VNDPASLIPRLTSAELRDRIGHESVSAGMIPKLRACADAVDGGVRHRAHPRRARAAFAADRAADR